MSPRRRCAPFSRPIARKKKPRPDYGKVLDFQCRALHFPPATPEHRFHPVRKWRFDRAWIDQKIAVEIEGGVFVSGRHTRGSGFREDCVKYAEAAVLGWRVIRVLPEQIQSGQAVAWLSSLLPRNPPLPPP